MILIVFVSVGFTSEAFARSTINRTAPSANGSSLLSVNIIF